MFIFILGCKSRDENSDQEPRVSVNMSSKEERKVNNVFSESTLTTTNDYDSIAIGDIKFGITQSDFNIKKNDFLKNHPTLNGIPISNFKGFFYNGQLAAIEIISHKHSIFRNHEAHYWSDLYAKKYPQHYNGCLNGYESTYKLIDVTDISPKLAPSNNFKEVINREYEQLFFQNLLPDKEFESNVDAWMYVDLAFENINTQRAEKLKKQMDKEIATKRNDPFHPSITIYQYYYNLIRDDANKNIQLHNDKLKDAPSWSIIRIIFKPLLNQYTLDVRNTKMQKEQELHKDVDLI